MKINSLEELKAEQKKLVLRKMILESEITKDFEELKKELEPLKLLTKSAGTVLISKNNGILGNSLGFIADFITNNILLKNSGLLTRLIVPYLVKNTTSNFVENNKSKIAGFIGKLISKLAKKNFSRNKLQKNFG